MMDDPMISEHMKRFKKSKTRTLTKERLQEVIDYCQDTGLFRWKTRASTGVKPGDLAGCKSKTGHLVIQIDGVVHLSHRLAWLYIFGVHPDKDIDHKDCDRANNKMSNLRLALHVENCRNQKARFNRTGYKGVSWVESRGVYVSCIRRQDKKKIYLGSFPTAELAHKAYCDAADKYHGEFARYE